MSKDCEYVHRLFNDLEKFSFSFDKSKVPKNGIYILFENGEIAHSTQRIVRIGTHTGDGNLPARIKEHFLSENKDRSIFRKNIGRALLNRSNDSYLAKWEYDLTKREKKEKYKEVVDMEKQRKIEKEISKYIQNNFLFSVLPIDEKERRMSLETKIISTISLCDECKQSALWLGYYSTQNKIRESGLWQEVGLNKLPLDENDIAYLCQKCKK